jgi:hypothetical protein
MKMKKMCVVLMLSLLLSASMAFGQATVDNRTSVTTSQDQVMQGQGFGQASADATGGSSSAQTGDSSANIGFTFAPNTTNNTTYPKYNTPVTNNPFVGMPWMMPGAEQTAYANALAADLRNYCGKWKRQEVERILRAAGFTDFRFPEVVMWGWGGYKWSLLLRHSNPRVDEIDVDLNQTMIPLPDGKVMLVGESLEEISKEHHFLGDDRVTGSKGKDQFVAFMIGLELAMNGGVNKVLLKPEMNTVHTGSGFASTPGGATAAPSYSVALIGGFSLSDAKNRAEPVIKLAAYEKDGNPIAPSPTGPASPSPRKPKGENLQQQVNPDILKSGAEEKPKLWYWGIGTTPETERRAQMSQSDILRMSPSFK